MISCKLYHIVRHIPPLPNVRPEGLPRSDGNPKAIIEYAERKEHSVKVVWLEQPSEFMADLTSRLQFIRMTWNLSHSYLNSILNVAISVIYKIAL